MMMEFTVCITYVVLWINVTIFDLLYNDFISVVVCQSLKNSLNIEWLDFTSCNISHHGACVIADLIKVNFV